MRVLVTDDAVQIQLAPWEMILGLMRNITVRRSDISDVRVVSNPMREAMRAGMKAGLRIPWLLYVARTIRLDQIIIVRRRGPGLAFAVSNRRLLRKVLVSMPDAETLAQQLQSS